MNFCLQLKRDFGLYLSMRVIFGKFSKLIQTGPLAEYQLMFEQLANKIPGVPDHILVSCLCQDLEVGTKLRIELQVYRPQSLFQAMGLARLFADKSGYEMESQTGGRRTNIRSINQ